MKKLCLVLFLMLFLVTGCSVSDWTLVGEGNLIEIRKESYNNAFIVFDNGKVLVITGKYYIYAPEMWEVGEYYYLYKENGYGTWNRFHIVSEKR